MGFPEARKLAKDINKKIEVSADEIVEYISMMTTRLDDMCAVLMEIAAKTGEKQYVPGTNVIKTIYSGTTSLSTSKYVSTETFTAEYNGAVNIIIDIKGSNSYGNDANIQIYKGDTRVALYNFQNPDPQGEQKIIPLTVVKGEVYQVKMGCSYNAGPPTVGPVNVCGYIQTVE